MDHLAYLVLGISAIGLICLVPYALHLLAEMKRVEESTEREQVEAATNERP